MSNRIWFGLAVMLMIGSAAFLFESRGQTQPKGDAKESTAPPDIKVGVSVLFVTNGGFMMTNLEKEERALKVAKVQGNWVFFEGKYYVGNFPQEKGWVNFDTVNWYRVLSKPVE